MTRRTITILAFAVLTTGCAAPSAEGQADASADEPAISTPAVPGSNPEDPLDFGEEANTAVVTIGGERFEFTDLYCVNMGGALSAKSIGGDPQVSISLPPPDWETSNEEWQPPSIRVSGDEPYFDHQAQPELAQNDERIEAGMSQVDSFTTDGLRATGSATFVDTVAIMMQEEPDPVEGTFEVTCGG